MAVPIARESRSRIAMGRAFPGAPSAVQIGREMPTAASCTTAFPSFVGYSGDLKRR